jgi:hypothetical protein
MFHSGYSSKRERERKDKFDSNCSNVAILFVERTQPVKKNKSICPATLEHGEFYFSMTDRVGAKKQYFGSVYRMTRT